MHPVGPIVNVPPGVTVVVVFQKAVPPLVLVRTAPALEPVGIDKHGVETQPDGPTTNVPPDVTDISVVQVALPELSEIIIPPPVAPVLRTIHGVSRQPPDGIVTVPAGPMVTSVSVILRPSPDQGWLWFLAGVLQQLLHCFVEHG
jgi:hypothetical protein